MAALLAEEDREAAKKAQKAKKKQKKKPAAKIVEVKVNWGHSFKLQLSVILGLGWVQSEVYGSVQFRALHSPRTAMYNTKAGRSSKLGNYSHCLDWHHMELTLTLRETRLACPVTVVTA